MHHGKKISAAEGPSPEERATVAFDYSPSPGIRYRALIADITQAAEEAQQALIQGARPAPAEAERGGPPARRQGQVRRALTKPPVYSFTLWLSCAADQFAT